jgi:hypothetical protein
MQSRLSLCPCIYSLDNHADIHHARLHSLKLTEHHVALSITRYSGNSDACFAPAKRNKRPRLCHSPTK